MPAQDDTAREYGKTHTYFDTNCKLFHGLPAEGITWMSHGDYMAKVPEGFALTAHTDHCPNGAIADEARGFYGVQYHPEVNHTEHGTDMIRNFLYEVCGCTGSWTMGNYMRQAISDLREKIGDGKVLLALSGGVDSSVAAALLAEAVGRAAHVRVCGSRPHAQERRRRGGAGLRQVEVPFYPASTPRADFWVSWPASPSPSASARSSARSSSASSRKRPRRSAPWTSWRRAPSIPTWWNRAPARRRSSRATTMWAACPTMWTLKEIVEPLRQLFKDEVRELGRELGLPEYLVMRQPFPGPGLAIRVIGELTKEKLDLLRDADAIFREE